MPWTLELQIIFTSSLGTIFDLDTGIIGTVCFSDGTERTGSTVLSAMCPMDYSVDYIFAGGTGHNGCQD